MAENWSCRGKIKQNYFKPCTRPNAMRLIPSYCQQTFRGGNWFSIEKMLGTIKYIAVVSIYISNKLNYLKAMRYTKNHRRCSFTVSKSLSKNKLNFNFIGTSSTIDSTWENTTCTFIRNPSRVVNVYRFKTTKFARSKALTSLIPVNKNIQNVSECFRMCWMSRFRIILKEHEIEISRYNFF